MEYIVYQQPVVLHHVPGKGAWTYHVVVPNSQDIAGKRGEMLVSGDIDGYPLVRRQLAPLKDQDKMLSINQTVRNAINKKGGDIVTLTLYLLPNNDAVIRKGF